MLWSAVFKMPQHENLRCEDQICRGAQMLCGCEEVRCEDLRCEGTWMWRSKTQDVTSSCNRHGNCYTRKPTYAETQKHSPLPQTQFTHSNVPNPHARKTSAPNPHARKAATRNSRSRPETNFKHNTRGTKHNKTLEKQHKTPVKPWPNTCHARAKRNNKT